MQTGNGAHQGSKVPVFKELADFDFSAIPKLNKARVLDLARGEYTERRESILLVRDPGLGKTHLAIGLGLAACRHGHKVRFLTTAGLVNESCCRLRKKFVCTI